MNNLYITTNGKTRTEIVPELETFGALTTIESVNLRINANIGAIDTNTIQIYRHRSTRGFTVEGFATKLGRFDILAEGFKTLQAAIEWLQIELDYSAT